MHLHKTTLYLTLSIIICWTVAWPYLPMLASELDKELAYDLPEDTHSVATFYIQEIDLKNAWLLSKRKKRQLLAPYLNQYLGGKQISQLVEQLRIFYIKQGYPTTYVKVPLGQDLQQGMLKLVVVRGIIEKIKLKQHKPRDSGKVATAFPWLQGKPLYLKHLEQGIDQINAVPSSRAILKILPGLQEGGSIIQIDNPVINPFRAEIGTDNLGGEETGKWRGKANIALDNLLSINDNIILHCTSNKAKEIAETKLRNHFLMISFSFPLGYYMFSTSHDISSSINPVKTQHHTCFHTNKNRRHHYAVKRLLYKTRIHKAFLTLSIAQRKTANYLEDIPMDNQSGGYSNMKVSTNHIGLLLSGQYTVDVNYHQGLDLLSNPKDAFPEQIAIPSTQFKKLTLYLGWIRPWTLLSKQLDYQFHFSAQYSRDELLSSEQYSIVGLDQVRGFSKSYTGNKGLYLKQEVSLHNLFSFISWLRLLQVLVGVDIGYLPQVSSMDPQIATQSMILTSWVCECKYASPWLSVDLTYARPFSQPKYLTDNTTTGQVYISINVNLHNCLPRFR